MDDDGKENKYSAMVNLSRERATEMDGCGMVQILPNREPEEEENIKIKILAL